MSEDLKPCPFCGGDDVRYSMKTSGHFHRKYQATFYCNSCHSYGPRILSEKLERSDFEGINRVKADDGLKLEALTAWNTRAPTPNNQTKENGE